MYLFGKTRTVPMMAGPVGKYYQLGYYRPNQAYDRSIIRGRTSLYRSADLRGLGDDTTTAATSLLSTPVQVSPGLLLGGLAALGAAFYLFGAKRGPQMRAKKIARLSSQRASLSKRIKELETE